MRNSVYAIVAAIGLAAHPAFAQANRTGTAFWKSVQATCDATAAKPPSELGQRIAQTAIDEFTRFGGHQIDSDGRLFHFGLTEAEHEEDDGGGRPATLGHLGWWQVMKYWRALYRRRSDRQARGARLSRRLGVRRTTNKMLNCCGQCRRTAARGRRRVRSGDTRDLARGGVARRRHRHALVGGLHQLRDPAVGRRGKRVPVFQRPSRLHL